MIYISAQPDDLYFLWQLELQLFNFRNVGIAPGDIHVLIAYDPEKGLNEAFSEFVKGADKACIYLYPDMRRKARYKPSVRPHLLWQHFSAHPEMKNEWCMYHDSDILFREKPVLDLPENDLTWLVSDTRSYIDSNHLMNIGGRALLDAMCGVIGIDPELVTSRDQHAGGAQYVMTGTDGAFWKKAEEDCERLFQLLDDFNSCKHNADSTVRAYRSAWQHYDGIDAWCTDMWVVLWNAWQQGISTRIHPELDFCWPRDPSAEWERKKILHYAGVSAFGAGNDFCKGFYEDFPPFFEDLRHINQHTCSGVLVDLIRQYRQHRALSRPDLGDVTFLLMVRIDSVSRHENLMIILRWLDKYLNTNIIILEADNRQHLDSTVMASFGQYLFVQDDNPLLHRTKYLNQLIKMATTPIVALYDIDVVVAPDQLLKGAEAIRSGQYGIAFPYDGTFLEVNGLFKAMFARILDVSLFSENLIMLELAGLRSVGGIIMVNKETYTRCGMENEHFFCWGPEDKERVKRMEVLGHDCLRIKGPMYHLPHDRGLNSRYTSEASKALLMEEYLKIASMKQEELRLYIASWPWWQETA